MYALQEWTSLSEPTITTKRIDNARGNSHDSLARGEHCDEVDDDEACGLESALDRSDVPLPDCLLPGSRSVAEDQSRRR